MDLKALKLSLITNFETPLLEKNLISASLREQLPTSGITSICTALVTAQIISKI